MIDFTAVLNDLDGAAISDGGETKVCVHPWECRGAGARDPL